MSQHQSLAAEFDVPESLPEDVRKIAEPYAPVLEAIPPVFPPLKMSAVKDQGKSEKCGCFAVTALLEFKHKKLTLAECVLIIRSKDQSTRGLMQFGEEKGTCENRYWPFKKEQILPCATLISDNGPRHSFDKLVSVFARSRAQTLADATAEPPPSDATIGERTKLLRGFLAEYRVPAALEVPVLFSVEGWPGWGWDLDDGNVRVADPKKIAAAIAFADKKKRWHVIAICGYDDTKRRFNFKNSWGTDFGEDGFGTISYNFVDHLSTFSIAGV
jgi:hypothetical protein